MTFVKGTSGNPNGRPKGKRALTEILETAGDLEVSFKGTPDVKLARKQILAKMIWEVVTTGQTTLINGKTLKVAGDDWFNVVQFLYKHIDGAPTLNIDHTSDGEPLPAPQIYLPAIVPDDSSD